MLQHHKIDVYAIVHVGGALIWGEDLASKPVASTVVRFNVVIKRYQNIPSGDGS